MLATISWSSLNVDTRYQWQHTSTCHTISYQHFQMTSSTVRRWAMNRYAVRVVCCHGYPSQLEELDISGNPIKSMKPLKSLKVSYLTFNLPSFMPPPPPPPPPPQVLYAQEMSWTSIRVLCPVQTLQQLHVSKNKWSTLEGLSGLFPSLTVLDVRWNRIGTMEGLVRGCMVWCGVYDVVW